MKFIGIRQVASETKLLKDETGGKYMQLNYNTTTGSCWVDWLYGYAGNSFSQYDDPDIITCGYIYRPLTQKEIKEKIINELDYLEMIR